MDRLHSMRVFARVADLGSFAQAAREMNMSPAVVTRLVADLEQHLDARLITRTTRRLALTDIGEIYLERVRLILSEVEEAEAHAGSASADPRGHLRLLAPPAFAVHQIAKHLPRFHALYPGVTVELSAPGIVDTADENFDITIVTTARKPIDGDFVAHRLACSEVIVAAAPDYLDRMGRPQHPDDLIDHQVMVPSFFHGLDFVRTGADGVEETVHLSARRPVLGTPHTDTLYAAALHGLGIAGLPSFVVEEALLEDALERVLPEWQLMTVTIYAAMPTRRHVPARTRAMMNFLVETFGGAAVDPWLISAGCSTVRAKPKVA